MIIRNIDVDIQGSSIRATWTPPFFSFGTYVPYLSLESDSKSTSLVNMNDTKTITLSKDSDDVKVKFYLSTTNNPPSTIRTYVVLSNASYYYYSKVINGAVSMQRTSYPSSSTVIHPDIVFTFPLQVQTVVKKGDSDRITTTVFNSSDTPLKTLEIASSTSDTTFDNQNIRKIISNVTYKEPSTNVNITIDYNGTTEPTITS